MKKIVKNLESKTQSSLFESVIDDTAELLGVDASELEKPIDRLNFSDYLELGNAVDIGDEELAREILGMVSDIGEVSAFDADDEDNEDYEEDLIDKFDDGDSDDDFDDDDDDSNEFDMGLDEADNAYGSRGDNAYSSAPSQSQQTQQSQGENDDEEADEQDDTLAQTSIAKLKADATKQANQKPARATAQLSATDRAAAMKRLKDLKQGDEVFVRGLDGKPVRAVYQGADKSRQDFMAAVKTDKDRANTRTFSYDDLIAGDELEGDELMDESFQYEDQDSVEAVKNAIWWRIRKQHLDLIDKHGIDAVTQAVESTASFYGAGGLDEIGSSDVSAFVDSVMRELGEPSMFEGKARHTKDLNEDHLKVGATVTVPYKGKMVKGKIVRSDKGDKHGSPFYVVDVGDAESIKVPSHKIEEGIFDFFKGKPRFYAVHSMLYKRALEDGDISAMRKLSQVLDGSQRKQVANMLKDKVAKGVEASTMKNARDLMSYLMQGDRPLAEDEDLARMKRLAGIKETASGGSTGAGAIASAPAAVGGMQKRNPSIYATKPEPKPRKKDKKGKKDDGLGRSKKT